MTILNVIERINSTPAIQQIFYLKIVKKFEYDGYINTREFCKNNWNSEEKKTANCNSELDYIFYSKNSRIQNFDTITTSQEKLFKRILTLIICNEINNKEIVISENKVDNQKEVDRIIIDFLTEYIQFAQPRLIVRVQEYYIYNSNLNIKVIRTLDEYLKEIESIDPSIENSIFFRGQSNINYLLLPSILRNKKWYDNENYLCKSMTRLCPRSFNGLTSHIDNLVEMQHYQLPTRLLDISKNALVALLFACLDNPFLDGEVIVFSEKNENIKYGKSDTVSILSCLSQFSSKEQHQIINCIDLYGGDKKQFNEQEIIQKLLHEIKAEKPAFRDKINPEDIKKNIFAMPALLNDRIIKQSGAFIITGLVDYEEAKYVSDKLNTKRYKEKSSTPIFVIDQISKKLIKKQLNLCDINEASVFPEIDKVAQYLKENL